MEDIYINSSSQNQSFDHSNITSVENIDFMYVVTYIINGISLPLILVAIYALYSLVRSDHVAPIFVINLLISDLIQLCYMIIEVATPQDVEISVIFFNMYFFGLFASVYFMVCIATERYLVIAHPLWYRFRRTIKISVGVCVVVWIFSFVCVVPIYFWNASVTTHIIFSVVLLLPYPLLIFFLAGTLRALSAAISVRSDEKRRIVGILILVLLIYTLLFLPSIIGLLTLNKTLFTVSTLCVRLSPLADLVLYIFMRKGIIDKLLASVCCCRMDSNDINSSSNE